MKNIFFIAFILVANTNLFAKKVKFAVDMDTNIVSPNGIHVTGDFQAIAGFPGGDWTSNETVCTQVGSSTIYSVIVDIPAFAKYEYKFVNGDQFYEVEFVPVESRVGYDFNDNRWLWVDSLTNDTTFVGAIKFSGNAPAGLSLMRFIVDLSTQTTISSRPHVAGNFQSWNPASTSLYSFGDSIFEIIHYVTSGNYEFKFINGNAWGVDESVPTLCNVNGNRGLIVTKDTVLAAYCFASCFVCNPASIFAAKSDPKFSMYPNPTADYTLIEFTGKVKSPVLLLTDLTGRVLRSYENSSRVRIEKNELNSGIYFVNLIENNRISFSQKLVIQ